MKYPDIPLLVEIFNIQHAVKFHIFFSLTIVNVSILCDTDTRYIAEEIFLQSDDAIHQLHLIGFVASSNSLSATSWEREGTQRKPILPQALVLYNASDGLKPDLKTEK